MVSFYESNLRSLDIQFLFNVCLSFLATKGKFRIILCLCDPVSVEACVSSSAVARLVHLALLELQPDLAHESCHQPQQPHLVSSSEVENGRSRSSLVAVSVGPRGCNLIQFVVLVLIMMWILIWMICYWCSCGYWSWNWCGCWCEVDVDADSAKKTPLHRSGPRPVGAPCCCCWVPTKRSDKCLQKNSIKITAWYK